MIELLAMIFSVETLMFILTIQILVYTIRGSLEFLFPKLTSDLRLKKLWSMFVLKSMPSLIALAFGFFGQVHIAQNVNWFFYCISVGALSNIAYDGIKKVVKSKLEKFKS